jgi:VWFA-related protein
MRRGLIVLACWLVAAASSWTPPTSAQQPASQAPSQAPVPFKTGIDVVQLDVSVLDGERRPVKGLTAADFTILEDGESRPIVGFSAVELAGNARTPAAFEAIAPDVATNLLPPGRIVGIVLDQSTPPGPPAEYARRLARSAIEALDPADLAAVIYTGPGRSLDFTTDRARLLDATRNLSLGMSPRDTGDNFERGECACGVCSLETIGTIAEALGREPHRRKTILFIGSRIQLYEAGPGRCAPMLETATRRMTEAVQRANVTIHTFDPTLLQPTVSSAEARTSGLERANAAGASSYQESLRELAARTGGRAVLNTNAPAEHLRGILDETSTYYLLAFQAPHPQGAKAFHPVTVRVNRPGVAVRTRSAYAVAGDTARTKLSPSVGASPAPGGNADGALAALASAVLPDPGIPLTLSAAPFAIPGFTKAAVVVTIGVTSGDTPASSGSTVEIRTGPPVEQVEVLTSAFPTEGGGAEWHRQRLDLRVRDTPAGQLRYEALSRLDLAPGHYEVRVAVKHEDGSRSGSVHGFVDVPNFAADPLSLSGLILHDAAAPTATPADVLAGAIPAVPTTRRRFTAGDQVTAFVRIHQRRRDTPLPVSVTFSILDKALQQVFTRAGTLEPSAFNTDRWADARLSVPLSSLPAGEYVLRVDSVRGEARQRREMRVSLMAHP